MAELSTMSLRALEAERHKAELSTMSLRALEAERHKADLAVQAGRARKRQVASEIHKRLEDEDAQATLSGKSEGQIDAIVRVASQRLGQTQKPIVTPPVSEPEREG